MLADGGECVSDLGRGARPGGAVRGGGVGLDGVPGDRPDRVEPGLLGGVARGARAGARAVLGAARRARAVDDRRRRDADHRAFGEGGGGRQLQGRLRVPSRCMAYADETREALAGLLRPGQRGREHRRRPHGRCSSWRSSRSPRSTSRRSRSWCAPTRPARRTRSLDYCREERDAVLGRLRADRAGPRRDPPNPRGCLGRGARPGRLGARRTARSPRSPTASISSSWPEGSRLIVRRERPHPGAQLSFTDHDGYRFQAILTDQTDQDIAVLECRHRQHAHVEDRIRDDKDTGLAKFPFKEFALNEVWLEIVHARARPDRLDPGARCSTASSPRPSPSGCATGCCTSPAGSRSPAAAPSSTSRTPGPGPAELARRVPETQSAPSRPPADNSPPPTHTTKQTPRPPATITAARKPANTATATPRNHRKRRPQAPHDSPPTSDHRARARPTSHIHTPTARSGLIWRGVCQGVASIVRWSGGLLAWWRGRFPGRHELKCRRVRPGRGQAHMRGLVTSRPLFVAGLAI